MDLTPGAVGWLGAYVAPFTRRGRDRRAAALLGAVIRGIIGGERLVCARIAAFPPSVGRQPLRRPAEPADADGADPHALDA